MAFSTRASLVKWQARVIVRKALHTKAQRDLTSARKADLHPRQHLVDRRNLRAQQLKEARDMVTLRKEQIVSSAVPSSKGGWHPKAVRYAYSGEGTFVAGAPKRIVWHTTETKGLPNYGGSAPHFTFEPSTGKMWQHYPITVSARALVHPTGVETNRQGAIQVELLGYAGTTQDWNAAAYERIAGLARWLEKHGDVPAESSVKFFKGVGRLTSYQWLKFSGHCGHCHVPGNSHWDPGALKIALILKGGK